MATNFAPGSECSKQWHDRVWQFQPLQGLVGFFDPAVAEVFAGFFDPAGFAGALGVRRGFGGFIVFYLECIHNYSGSGCPSVGCKGRVCGWSSHAAMQAVDPAPPDGDYMLLIN